MQTLDSPKLTVMFLSIGVLLGAARVCGELAKRLRQPSVVGEIIAGVLLGPTLLGVLAPHAEAVLFPASGEVAVLRHGLVTLALALYLLVAGMEVDLGTVWRQGRPALFVSAMGLVVPFALGFACAWFLPTWVSRVEPTTPLVFSLFFATALSISALPVIARTLLELGLFRTDLGMVIVAAAIVQDLVGWIVFAVVLGLMGASAGHGFGIGATIGLTLAFVVVMLVVVRPLVHRALPWVHAYASWPAGVLALTLTLGLFASALTEWIGVHAIFGGFMTGVAVGDSRHLRERTRATVDQFVSAFFAPLFFASIGLEINFVKNLDWQLAAVVLLIACVGKVAGSTLGARFGGVSRREAWAIGFGMNARGAMEIVLGLLALESGMIGKHLFVALVVMALVTSTLSGPLMQRTLRRRSHRLLADHLVARAFLPKLAASDREGAIRELAQALAPAVGVSADALGDAAWHREQLMPTGLGEGVAAPHARLPEAREAKVAIGLAREGIDFDAPDGRAAQLVFLIVTPKDDDGAQLELMRDVARVFQDPAEVQAALSVTSFTELLALLRTARA
jgi:K+:H+ antiporter